jgi:hypothetical protein
VSPRSGDTRFLVLPTSLLHLGLRVPCVLDIGGAFFGWVLSEDGCACVYDGVACSGFGLSQQSLELGEHLLDRVEVGGVFRQEDEARPDGEVLARALAFGL